MKTVPVEKLKILLENWRHESAIYKYGEKTNSKEKDHAAALCDAMIWETIDGCISDLKGYIKDYASNERTN